MRIERPSASGRTEPYLLRCRRANGEDVETFVKFSATCDRQAGSLAIEAVTAVLAKDLGLPVPEPVLVELTPKFVLLLPEKVRGSVSFAFGSVKLPDGFSPFLTGTVIPPTLRQTALEIFAFDMLVENADRRIDNPNCHYNGIDFAIFDHELAFTMKSVLFWKPIWEVKRLGDFHKSHIFFSEISRDQVYDLRRFTDAWLTISDQRLTGYFQALPPEWESGFDYARDALSHIANVRTNIVSAVQEIGKALS